VLVPPADPAAIASAVIALLDEPERRRCLAANAARDAARRFDLERQLDVTEAWYREARVSWRRRRDS
jgi:glycosyltransferase involved in cell wall biosynthesis